MVIPLDECIARPGEGTRQHFLVDHLVRVAMRAGDSDGSTNDQLAFLAGLLHDAAKCHVDWQDYIKSTTSRKKGPPHSPMGAALFTFVAEHLIPTWHHDRVERLRARDRMLNWLMAINGHHGRLGDFHGTSLPWMTIGSRYSVSGLVSGCDVHGIFQLVSKYFPNFSSDPQEFAGWLDEYDRTWVKLVEYTRPKLVEKDEPHRVAMRFPLDFSRLIIADRIDAGGLADDCLRKSDAADAVEAHARYCRAQAAQAIDKGASQEMVKLRATIQRDAVKRFRKNPSDRFYTLLLPTGYGKTLTSLRIALESSAFGHSTRIIYVAPYLSILSQATKEIAAATQMEVFQHHHLSYAAMGSNIQGRFPNDNATRSTDLDDDFEILDTWQVPILATTFNQFFRALFPCRAQHTLRISAVKNSFVIVDEPQIIDIGVWNLFLRALSAFAVDHDCQILFTTATLPPLHLGLPESATPLSDTVPTQHRYDVEFIEDDFTTAKLVDYVVNQAESHPNLAVVLNTVRDAATVFQSIDDRLKKNTRLFCLTAMMLPFHKHATIATISKLLDEQRARESSETVIVVCTQMLEAGVDLSFRRIFRSRPILPSIAQVAGRANRHCEAEPAKVFVFPFKSDGDVELRRFVYRDRTACEITDRILTQYSHIPESDMRNRLDEYYDRCWRENTQSARLKDFIDASLGRWSCLGGLEPFGFSMPREEVFVPVDISKVGSEWHDLVHRFAPDGAEQLLDRELDPAFKRGLSFRERKLFSIVMQLFTVSVHRRVAVRIASPVNEWLWKINRGEDYSMVSGLAHWLVDQQGLESSDNSDGTFIL